MTIDRKTALDLADLYRQRERLQHQKSKATSKNLWIGVLTRGSAETRPQSVDVRSYTDAEQIIDSIGGIGDAASIAMNAIVSAFETEMQKLDAKIAELGGEV